MGKSFKPQVRCRPFSETISDVQVASSPRERARMCVRTCARAGRVASVGATLFPAPERPGLVPGRRGRLSLGSVPAASPHGCRPRSSLIRRRSPNLRIPGLWRFPFGCGTCHVHSRPRHPPPHTHTLARARLVAVLKPVKRGAQAAKATRADISQGGSASLKPIAEPTPARDTCGGSATRLSHGPCQCRCRCARPRSVRQRGASRVGSTEQRSGLGPTHPQ